MENEEPNAALPLSIKMLSSEVNVEEQAQNETNLNSVMETSNLAQIEFRIQQLQGRHLLLQKTLSCTKKEERVGEGSSSSAEPPSEDGEQLGELETIQKELLELQALKDNMVAKGANFIARASRGPQVNNHVYRESPRGGIYTLPLPDMQLEGTAAQTQEHRIIPGVAPIFQQLTLHKCKTLFILTWVTETEMFTFAVFSWGPVESLGSKPGTTKCPSCQAVVVTRTQLKVGAPSFMVCFVCSILGCVIGCCLIPFFAKRFKNVHHSCPRCETHIYTFMPV
ncbi:uncharacterized protein LOC112154055 isoform X1 [Oryzias melastigma]|uniref:uncharacterized protein LOC112154055 isoform X1 n=1 Tax=Oryzias melastigma TaxID=30732 RepID=UPI00168D1F61|nr:uncharacterized protein LOC112154055 isoform X1 [Oryzias melastigma]XP_036072852.1 uncharacterized protein LOC112154055 isoform X1 [Oryzias melastigma]XP_036072853.1 uncharacterized protein LOC112154055 isoform X1 [Oryzias melastigma]XP_036072854.1 uncharacterized protein LOC112154055 isoform X1 [Oryzias melastigma]XP_036072855.1 uncharacterized protein LOC112154055 isoform X1 [Oryzias melastigma]XP_036072856.1 uncharacterized protein LOC112154055 isoform X1 [Oryzias melastigma]XP_03607285